MASAKQKPVAASGSDFMASDTIALFRQTCRLALALTATLVTACSHTPANTDTSPELAAQAQIFNTRCSACHATPAPRRHNYEEWRILLGIMEQRMQERGMNTLSERDRTAIMAYLKRTGR
jgi:cytochrome c5